MRLKSVFSEAAQALRFNRQRSILTVISLAWGVACFVILYSYGEGFDYTLQTAFLAVGQDLIVTFPGHTSSQAGGERAGRRIRLDYITQPKGRPPSFVLFLSRADAVPDAYRRYLVNSLRESFNLPGTPIRLTLREKKNPYSKRK